MNRVIPAILEKDWQAIERKIEIVKNFSNTVHIDFIDGIFSQNKTFMDFAPFVKYSKELNFEAHLMTDNPIQYIEGLASAGFRKFLGHVEKMPDIDDFIAQGQILGEVGLAIDGPSAIESLNINFEDLDAVLVMGINAGFSGQEFLTATLDKIKKLREKTIIPIEVDGGINEQTIVAAKIAGANRFAITSYLFNNPDPKAAFEKLSKLSALMIS